MQCSSPRASIGFKRLPRPWRPRLAGADNVMHLSTKRMIRPSDLAISLRTALSRSSNSPRYFAPAISAPISRANIVLSFSVSGTSPFQMRCASPSTTAVLPTPGSPMSAGLFFVFRQRIVITRRISWSRPITGSSLPFFAASTRSVPYLRSASYVYLRILARDALVFAHVCQRSQEFFRVDAILCQEPRRGGVPLGQKRQI